MKKFISVFLAIVMMFSLSSVAYATNGTLSYYMKNQKFGYGTDYYTEYYLPHHQGNGSYSFPVYLPAFDEQYNNVLDFFSDYNDPSSTSTYLIQFKCYIVYVYKFSEFPTLLEKTTFTYGDGTKEYKYYFSASSVECIMFNPASGFISYYPDYTKNCCLYISTDSKESISFIARNPEKKTLNSIVPVATDVKSVSFNVKGRYRAITLNHKYPDGTTAKSSQVYSYLPGASYSISISNYNNCVPNISKLSGTMPDENLEFDIIYSKTSLAHNLTVNYLYEDGSVACDSLVWKYEAGAEYNIPSPQIDGFFPSVPVVSGIMPSADYSVNVVYSTKQPTNTLTINYLYSENNPAADPITQEIVPGEEYSIPSPEISGYTPSIPVVSGTMPEEDLIIDVYYSKSFYNLTVKYQYADGTKAAEDTLLQYPSGFVYDVPIPQIDGYQSDKSSIAGTMPEGPVTEIVTYMAIPYTLTVNYQYADGSQAAESHQEQLTVGTHYSVPSPTVEGFHPNQTSVTGIMPAADVTSTVTYRKDSGGSGGTGPAGPGEGGESGGETGGGSGDGGDSGDDPFTPVLPPFSGNDPFIVPDVPEYSGYDPFTVPKIPGYSGYDPFIVPKIPAFSGYDPFSKPDNWGES